MADEHGASPKPPDLRGEASPPTGLRPPHGFLIVFLSSAWRRETFSGIVSGTAGAARECGATATTRSEPCETLPEKMLEPRPPPELNSFARQPPFPYHGPNIGFSATWQSLLLRTKIFTEQQTISGIASGTAGATHENRCSNPIGTV